MKNFLTMFTKNNKSNENLCLNDDDEFITGILNKSTVINY